MNWIKGNIPEYKSEFYWIATDSCMNGNITIYYQPVRYSESRKSWIDCKGEYLSSSSIVAYYPIVKPSPYTISK